MAIELNKNEILKINSRVDSCEKIITQLKSDKEYVLENYKIQNNTILYVSTILGLLLTIVIVYFGWRAQRVENEYERAKIDRDRIKEQFDLFFNELKEKKNEVNLIVNQISQFKADVEVQK